MAFRIRLTGGGYKPPQTVVVKSHSRKRWGKGGKKPSGRSREDERE